MVNVVKVVVKAACLAVTPDSFPALTFRVSVNTKHLHNAGPTSCGL